VTDSPRLPHSPEAKRQWMAIGVSVEDRSRLSVGLYDVPDILGSVAELTACNAGTEVELANGDRVVLDLVGEVVAAFGHGSYKNGDALILVQVVDVVADPHHLGVETQRDLAAVGREMVRNGVLDDLDELLVGAGGADLVPVEELHHETSEALERARYPHGRADLDEHAAGSLDVDLKLPRLVDGRVEQSEQALASWSIGELSVWAVNAPDG
jgi:hypothetical protein